jgi:ribosomal protein S18 acetylase RimI-like enzyme
MTLSQKQESSIKIIDITPELWETYKRIRLRGLQEDPQAFGRSYEEELAFPDEKWKSRAKNPFGTLAILDQEPIGTMSAYISDEDDKKVANIVGVFVATEVRGKKVGSRLMKHVLNKIDATPNIDVVRLSVNKNQIAAVGLYKKFGFKVCGEEAKKLGDGDIHIEYIMERVSYVVRN